MAASAWGFYNTFRKYVGNGTINLSSSIFRMALFQSAASAPASTLTLSTYSQISSEVANGNGYTTGGKTASATAWAQGASAKEYRFDGTAVVWSASSGNIANIKYAVVYISGASAGAQKLCFYSLLSSSMFTVTDGNSLTVTPSANGYFELN